MNAIIFDMDGVIIDSHSVAYQVLCETANQYGCNLTVDVIKSWGSLSSKQFWRRLKEEYHLSYDLTTLISSYDIEKEIENYKEIGLISGILELVTMLKDNGYKIALATSATRKRMNAVLDMFNLHDFFNTCICDQDVSMSKPNPEIFLVAAEKLGVEAKNCIVIEDSFNGLLAAKVAGMTCIGFKGLQHVNENMEEADWIINDFKEITIEDLKKIL